MKKLVIIPTYNEKENIQAIISTVIGLEEDFHILIVDDSSPDGTAEIVKKLQSHFPHQLHLSIRKVKDGVICTVIGRAYSGYSPSDIHVLNLPSAIFVAGDYLYVGDAMNGVVKRFRQSDIGCQ